MDSKSKLQQKVLGLKRGYTAKDIKYICLQAEHGQWRATVCICDLAFTASGAFHNKRQAETAAATKVLDSWIEVAKKLKNQKKKIPPHIQRKRGIFHPKRGYEREEENEEEEDGWSSDEGAPTQEDYIRVGKRMYEIYRIFQRDV